MSRTDFMEQLDRLLQDIPSAEREEALQYYNDYFDDAGKENEQAVMKALGNPARVAENIKRDLTESGTQTHAKASDEAIVEYGKSYEEENRQEKEVPESIGSGSGREKETRSEGEQGGSVYQTEKSSEVFGGSAYNEGTRGWEAQGGGAYGTGNRGGVFGGSADSRREAEPVYTAGAGAAGKRGRAMSGGAIALIVIGAVFLSPVGLGLLSVLFGVIACWFALILSAGVMTLALLVVLVVLVVVGIMCIFVDPLVGAALIGGGFIVGGLGLLSLMLTVAMAGIVTPAIFRGIGRLFARRA